MAMRVVGAVVTNHEGWSEAQILVVENDTVALVEMEHEWEDRDGSTTVLYAQPGFVEGDDLCDRIYAADGYDEHVNTKLKAIV